VVGIVLNEATRQAAGYYSAYGTRQGYYGRPLPEFAPAVPVQLNGTEAAPSRNGTSANRRAETGGLRRSRHGYN
jgi:hypothetical protein